MLGGLSRRTARPRGFAYEPRFYDADEEEARKRRLRFSRPSERRQHKTRQPAFVAVGLGLVAAFYVYTHLDAVVGGASTLLDLFFGA